MPDEKDKSTVPLSEDWLAVIVAFILIVLSTLNLIGSGGVPISF